MHGQKTDPKSVGTTASIIRSNRGFTLVEISITLVVGVIGIFGMSALFGDMAKIQRKASANTMLSTMRANIISAVINKEESVNRGWELSVADASAGTGNPDIGCLRTATACTKDDPKPLNLKDSSGGEIFYSSNPTRGVTFDGVLCNSFPGLACPFRWNLVTVFRCTGSAKTSCSNPIVEVQGDLVYDPGAGNTPIPGGINAKQFGILVRRGEKIDRNEPVVLSYVRNDVVATGEGGDCTVGIGVARKFNTIVTDPSSNAALTGPAEFSLTAGSYQCRIQAPAFKNGGNTIRLRDSVGAGGGIIDVTSAGVQASRITGDSVNVYLQTSFTLLNTTTLRVIHHCTEKPSQDTDGFGNTDDSFMLGMPVPDSTGAYSNGVTFTVVSCIKTSG